LSPPTASRFHEVGELSHAASVDEIRRVTGIRLI
jgi:hypothetical protein